MNIPFDDNELVGMQSHAMSAVSQGAGNVEIATSTFIRMVDQLWLLDRYRVKEQNERLRDNVIEAQNTIDNLSRALTPEDDDLSDGCGLCEYQPQHLRGD